jgi:hypothetical protein
MKPWFRKHAAMSDDVVRHAVEAKLGMLSRHADRITVVVSRAVVTLEGPIAADEVDYLAEIIGRVPGVKKLQNDLKVYRSDEDIPAFRQAADRVDTMGRPTAGSADRTRPTAPRTRVVAAGLAATATVLGMRLLRKMRFLKRSRWRRRRSPRVTLADKGG